VSKLVPCSRKTLCFRTTDDRNFSRVECNFSEVHLYAPEKVEMSNLSLVRSPIGAAHFKR